MAPLSGEKQNFYCSVYYRTLNSNGEAQIASKNLKKIVQDSSKPKLMHKWFECTFLPFKGENNVKKPLNKLSPES